MPWPNCLNGLTALTCLLGALLMCLNPGVSPSTTHDPAIQASKAALTPAYSSSTPPHDKPMTKPSATAVALREANTVALVPAVKVWARTYIAGVDKVLVSELATVRSISP